VFDEYGENLFAGKNHCLLIFQSVVQLPLVPARRALPSRWAGRCLAVVVAERGAVSGVLEVTPRSLRVSVRLWLLLQSSLIIISCGTAQKLGALFRVCLLAEMKKMVVLPAPPQQPLSGFLAIPVGF